MMYRGKGTITVFLSLISMLFLSLFCTMAESARVQAARTQAAAAFDMGLFSVFGEYDSVLLEEYDVWFFDASRETGRFSEDIPEKLLADYISPNIHVTEGISAVRTWNLFPTEMDECTVDKYALATDDGGQVFYRQVVENERELLAGNVEAALQKNIHEAEQHEKRGEQYEREAERADRNLQNALQELSHLPLLGNALLRFFHPDFFNPMGRIIEQDVIFRCVLQHRGNGIQIFMYGVFAQRLAAPPGPLAQFFCKFLQDHRPYLTERQTSNIRVRHLQHFSVTGQSTGFVSLGCPVRPMLRVGLELGVFTFVDTSTESFFQSLSLRIDILPDTAFWNLLGDINGARLHPLFPGCGVSITNCNFIFSFSALLNISHGHSSCIMTPVTTVTVMTVVTAHPVP